MNKKRKKKCFLQTLRRPAGEGLLGFLGC